MNPNIELQINTPKLFDLLLFLKETNFNASISAEMYALKVLKYATFITLMENRRIIGMSIVYTNRPEKDFAYLTYISIIKEYRGLGLGKMLLNQTILESKSKGFRLLKLEVNKSNFVARKLYESIGFVNNKDTTNSFYMEYLI